MVLSSNLTVKWRFAIVIKSFDYEGETRRDYFFIQNWSNWQLALLLNLFPNTKRHICSCIEKPVCLLTSLGGPIKKQKLCLFKASFVKVFPLISRLKIEVRYY